MPRKKLSCPKHGGTSEKLLCDICSAEGIDPCPCGGVARYFGEACMSSIMCDDCKASLWGINVPDLRPWWNKGARGRVWTRKEAYYACAHFYGYIREDCIKAAKGEKIERHHTFSEARWRNMLKQILGVM